MDKKERQKHLAEMTRPPGGFGADRHKWANNLHDVCKDVGFQPLLVGIDWKGSPERIAQEIVHVLATTEGYHLKYDRLVSKIDAYVLAKEIEKDVGIPITTNPHVTPVTTGRKSCKTPNLPTIPREEGCTYMHHELKCSWFFEALKDGTKTFDIRKNDRDFRVGDRVRISEYSHETIDEAHPWPVGLTGEFVLFRITYVLKGFNGIEDGYCILGLKPWVNE